MSPPAQPAGRLHDADKDTALSPPTFQRVGTTCPDGGGPPAMATGATAPYLWWHLPARLPRGGRSLRPWWTHHDGRVTGDGAGAAAAAGRRPILNHRVRNWRVIAKRPHRTHPRNGDS